MALIPSTDLSNLGSLQGLFNQALGQFLRSFDNAMPAIVDGYNPATNRATVTVPFNIVLTNGQKIKRVPIASVPVLRFGGGGYFIYTPLKKGDSGWIIACDRDIHNYLDAKGSQTTPNTLRAKSFSDSFFIPDSVFKGPPANSDALTIQSDDGNTKIEFEKDLVILQVASANTRIEVEKGSVTIKATNVKIDGNLTVTGESLFEGSLSASGESTMNANVTLNGNQRVNGNITASGDITPNVPS